MHLPAPDHGPRRADSIEGVLLAKGFAKDRELVTLARHLLDTERAARSVFADSSRFLKRWLAFFRLGASDAVVFLLHLRVAALLHDLGKANADFQAVVRGSREQQTLRHEHLSALILRLPAMLDWLGGSPGLDVDIVTAAVLSHHAKAGFGREKWSFGQSHGRGWVTLFLMHDDVRRILLRVALLLGLASPPPLPDRWKSDISPWDKVNFHAARAFRRSFKNDRRRQRFTLAVKAGLVAADAVASGLVREGHPLEAWIDDAVHAEPLASTDLSAAVLRPRIATIETRTSKSFELRDFQRGAALAGRRALLLAPCGSGKTLAAWKWIEHQLTDQQLGRTIFLYPTRASVID